MEKPSGQGQEEAVGETTLPISEKKPEVQVPRTLPIREPILNQVRADTIHPASSGFEETDRREIQVGLSSDIKNPPAPLRESVQNQDRVDSKSIGSTGGQETGNRVSFPSQIARTNPEIPQTSPTRSTSLNLDAPRLTEVRDLRPTSEFRNNPQHRLPQYTPRPIGSAQNGQPTWVDRVRTSFEQTSDEPVVMAKRPDYQNKPLLADRKPSYGRQFTPINNLQSMYPRMSPPFTSNRPTQNTFVRPSEPKSSKEYQNVQSNVLQLRREVNLKRKKTSDVIENLMEYVLQHQKDDCLLVGFSAYKTNPFVQNTTCNIL